MFAKTDILECVVPAIVKERVAHRVGPVGALQSGLRQGREFAVFNDPLSRVGPHIGNVQIRLAIVIAIEPGGAHSRTNIFETRARREIAKAPSFVDVEILPPEVVCYIQIGPAVIIEIAPGGCRAESVVVLVHSGFSRAILQESASVRVQLVAE